MRGRVRESPSCLARARGKMWPMLATANKADLDGLSSEQLRELALKLITELHSKDNELRSKEFLIAKLTHEMAILKRIRFAARSESSTPRSKASSRKTPKPICRHSTSNSRP